MKSLTEYMNQPINEARAHYKKGDLKAYKNHEGYKDWIQLAKKNGRTEKEAFNDLEDDLIGFRDMWNENGYFEYDYIEQSPLEYGYKDVMPQTTVDMVCQILDLPL